LGLALTGVTIKKLKPNKFEKGVAVFYIFSYLMMRLLFLVFMIPLHENMHPLGIAFIIIGGVFYILGVFSLSVKKLSSVIEYGI